LQVIWRTIFVFCLACTTLRGMPAQTMTLEKLLDRLEEQGAEVKSMSALLEQKKWTDILQEFDEGEFGRFLFLKKKDQVFLRKEIEDPQLSFLVIADSEVVFFQPLIKQAQKYRLGKNKDKAELLVLGFGTTREALEETYEMELLGEEKVGEIQTWILEMIPRSDKVQAFFSKIVLWIDAHRWIPIQQKLIEPTDDYLLVRFSEVQLNPKLSPSDFKLKLPKGTRIVGLN